MKDGEVIRTIINQKEKNESSNGGKMNFICEGKKILHTVTHIPSEGVYFGVCVINMYINK
jgi:hypothetical protein